MDEMNNMNEVTTEETSNEMTPVVTENNEVKTAENSGINTWAGIAAAVGVLTIGAIGAGIAKHKAKAKTEPKVEKEKKRNTAAYQKVNVIASSRQRESLTASLPLRQAVKDWQGRFKSASLNYQGDSP